MNFRISFYFYYFCFCFFVYFLDTFFKCSIPADNLTSFGIYHVVQLRVNLNKLLQAFKIHAVCFRKGNGFAVQFNIGSFRNAHCFSGFVYVAEREQITRARCTFCKFREQLIPSGYICTVQAVCGILHALKPCRRAVLIFTRQRCQCA